LKPAIMRMSIKLRSVPAGNNA